MGLKVSLILSLLLIPIFCITFFIFISHNIYNFFDLLLLGISLPFFVFSVFDLQKNKVNSYNLFTLIYSAFLIGNSLHISTFAEAKEAYDLILILLPLVTFFIILVPIEKFTRFRVKSFGIIKFETIFYFSAIAYTSLQLYVFFKVGFRIENYLFGEFSVSRLNDFAVEGVSGILIVLKWTMVILALYTRSRTRNFVFVMVVIFSFIGMVRGDIVRLFIIAMTFQIYKNVKSFFCFKTFAVILLFVIFFVQAGNFRSSLGGRIYFDISKMLGSILGWQYFDWFYAYTAINFDVLLKYKNLEVNGSFVDNLFYGLNWDPPSAQPNVNGLNAGTLYCFALMNNNLEGYLLNLFLLAIIYGVIVCAAKLVKAEGLYIYLVAMNLLSLFGNYLFQKYYLAVACLLLVLFGLIKKEISSNDTKTVFNL